MEEKGKWRWRREKMRNEKLRKSEVYIGRKWGEWREIQICILFRLITHAHERQQYLLK